MQGTTFLRQVARAYPRVRLHIVADNYGTPEHPAVQARLKKNPRITLHFTPTSGSWLNMVSVNRPSGSLPARPSAAAPSDRSRT